MVGSSMYGGRQGPPDGHDEFVAVSRATAISIGIHVVELAACDAPGARRRGTT